MENNYPNSPNTEDTTLAYLIRLVYQWRKLIASLIAVSLIISVITVYFILTVYYKSSAVFYPLSARAYDPRLMSEPASYDLYGGGTDADRLMSIGKSSVVRNYIIRKYNLAARYKIDTSTANGKHDIKNKFDNNFELKENERGALELTFFDMDADTAALIVNDVVNKINEINLLPTINNSKTSLESHMQISKEHYTLTDSMAATIKGGPKNPQTDLAVELLSLERFHDLSTQRQLSRQFELLEKKPTTIFIIESASPDFKKARPMRMVIVGLSAVGTFLFALALAALMENIKALKEKKII